MFLQRNIEVATQRLQTFVAFADPFGTELTDQPRVFVRVRKNTPADAVPSFEHRYIPARIL
ncbi:MAG: hypothetical protein UZ17_ACD001001808 [Acidobacteria bacterium OLB17]|nr:MAG: hypothetical protein UZ17_ACD001001808 [Acidobacteria bacterium OLB17]